MDDFYVTLFSNLHQDKFSDNTTSQFTALLPRPIVINPNEYMVALTDINHPKILGTVEGRGQQDQIVFPTIASENSFTYDLTSLADLILKHSTRPGLYRARRYFREFLDLRNLREFDVNEPLQRYRTQVPAAGSRIFRITPYEIAPQYRASMDSRTYFVFQSLFAYNMRQILFIILDTYRRLLTGPTPEFGIVVEKGKSVGDMLYLYAITFVNAIRNAALQYHQPAPSNYVFLYSDLVSPSIVGSEMARLLYAGVRQSEAEQDVIEVKNAKYLRVLKTYIPTISFFFADETGRQIMFEDGYLPVMIQLHFKRIMIEKNSSRGSTV